MTELNLRNIYHIQVIYTSFESSRRGLFNGKAKIAKNLNYDVIKDKKPKKV